MRSVVRRVMYRRSLRSSTAWGWRSPDTWLIVALTIIGIALFAVEESAGAAGFGILPGSVSTVALNQNGTIDTQAGSHPYQYTVSFAFKLNGEGHVEGNARDIYVDLPPGLIGDPTAVPRCSSAEFEGIVPHCSGNTQIGIVRSVSEEFGEAVEPVYDIVPPQGVVARFAANVDHKDVAESASVRTGSDYGVVVATNNIPIQGVESVEETIWGVPAAEGHNPERHCIINGSAVEGCASGAVPKPFLTLPTSCNSPLQTAFRVDSFAEPEDLLTPETALSRDAGGNPQGLSGCESLAFEPSLTLAPETGEADSPTGLTAEVHVPPSGLETIEGDSSADIKDTTVTLPEGMVINPGQAAGLQACPAGRPGPGVYGNALTTPEEKARGEEDDGPAECPGASKVGTVQIRTPLLEEELAGNVYVLPSNPPNLELLVAANDPVDGIYLKLVGHVHLDEATGRITTTFSETPQLPFSSFKLSFTGGAKAALSTPTHCGLYTTSTELTPWSAPFGREVPGSDSFQITSGSDGAPCPSSGPLPFAPSMTAGSTTDQAGAFTDFSMLLTRPDDQQRIETLKFKAPAGLLGELGNVPLCGEPQAAQGTCSGASQIGHATVEAGPGAYPLVIPESGRPADPIYLTGSYEGAPYGLSIVTQLLVGPFNLGTIVTRAKIEVDPRTAQLTITTDPLPQIIDGVPSDLRAIDAVIDRSAFMINPTNCETQSFSGEATGSEGASAPISSPFGVGSCRSLSFAPSFTATTQAKTSKADGASLSATLSFPTTPPGGQATDEANVRTVKVELPKQLPSRLTTLQKACTAAQFDANPAGCPVPSVVGQAVVHTPVLPVPLTGPAYFVSHGGEAFPSLVVVLQGYGVTIVVEATTHISAQGVTSLTFKSAPDAPFNSFTLTSPEGPYSALAANGSLCAPSHAVKVSKRVKLLRDGHVVRRHGRVVYVERGVTEHEPESLDMPTTIVGQNGAVFTQQTKIAVTGCPKKAALTHKKADKQRRGRSRRAPKKR